MPRDSIPHAECVVRVSVCIAVRERTSKSSLGPDDGSSEWIQSAIQSFQLGALTLSVSTYTAKSGESNEIVPGASLKSNTTHPLGA